MMIRAVEILSDGGCVSVDMKKNKAGSLTLGKKTMHTHHRTKDVMLMSPIDPRAMQNDACAIFQFQLPPPLNAHVYPSPLYVCKISSDSDPTGLAIKEFIDLCDTLGKMAQHTKVAEAIYDVPAVPLTQAEVDETFDDESEEDNDENSENDSCSASDDDDDWEIDDEDSVIHN